MTNRSKKASALLLGIAALLAPIALFADTSASSSPQDLQAQIDQQNAQISQLNSEIAQYQTKLNATDQTKKTLQNTLSQISLSLAKTGASIHLSQAQISATELQILQLAAASIHTKRSGCIGRISTEPRPSRGSAARDAAPFV